jgi:alkaline phosphatase D
MGDTIYLDSENPEDKIPAYEKLVNNIYYQKLKKNTKLLYTWDDHDFGINDAGSDYKEIEKSKSIFLNFIQEPQNSPRRKRKGVYDSYYFEHSGKIIQILLLDTRTFRSNLSKNFWGEIIPNIDPNATILGEDQWNWLDQEFQKKADVRLLVSSIQFHNDLHRFEKWGNFPNEKKKLFQLLQKHSIKGTLIISGDRHIGEMYKIQKAGLPTLFEITSSPLNKELTFPAVEPFHPDRIGNFVQESNFGLLRFIPEKDDLKIFMEIHLLNGLILQKVVNLSELQKIN